jgi:hypothetical protein
MLQMRVSFTLTEMCMTHGLAGSLRLSSSAAVGQSVALRTLCL